MVYEIECMLAAIHNATGNAKTALAEAENHADAVLSREIKTGDINAMHEALVDANNLYYDARLLIGQAQALQYFAGTLKEMLGGAI